MAATAPESAPTYPVSFAAGGNLNRLQYEQLRYVAGRLGLDLAIVQDIPEPDVPVLAQITRRTDFIGYEHFVDFNAATGFVRQQILTRAFDDCIDATPPRTYRGRFPRWPVDPEVIRSRQFITPREGLVIEPRDTVGLPPLPFEDVAALIPSLQYPKIHSTICAQYAIEAGGFVDIYAGEAESDKSNALFVAALARQVLTQISASE